MANSKTNHYIIIKSREEQIMAGTPQQSSQKQRAQNIKKIGREERRKGAINLYAASNLRI